MALQVKNIFYMPKKHLQEELFISVLGKATLSSMKNMFFFHLILLFFSQILVKSCMRGENVALSVFSLIEV